MKPQADIQSIARMLYTVEGQSLRQIERIIGVDHVRVWKWCKGLKKGVPHGAMPQKSA